MTTDTVSTKPLTDIANAIRQQNGTSASYKPREMAALDGTKADTAGVEDHKGSRAAYSPPRCLECQHLFGQILKR